MWLPIFGSSLSDPADERDARRAFESWRGELTVWLLPQFKKVLRWRNGAVDVVGVPSERLNRIDVYHIGRNGQAIGLSAERFPKRNLKGLLDGWLNIRKLDLHAQPVELKYPVPRLSNGKIRYEECEVARRPGPMIPITKFDDSAANFECKWPPPSASYRTMSPEAESLAEYGPLQRTDEGGSGVARSVKTGVAAICSVLGWPEPLSELISVSAGWDILYGQQKMRTIARLSGDHPAEALRQAEDQARKYVSDGRTSREFEWFWPTLVRGGTKQVVFEAEDFKLMARNWAALRDCPNFKPLLAESVTIRRVWGPLGLFWALLLEQLEEHKSFHSCQNCGRIIKGKRGKRFCGPKDHPDCYSERRALDQRRSRARRN